VCCVDTHERAVWLHTWRTREQVLCVNTGVSKAGALFARSVGMSVLSKRCEKMLIQVSRGCARTVPSPV